MLKNDYEIRYLPIFFEDLRQIITYIATELKNEDAAQKLLDDIEQAILKRLPIAESFEQYHSWRERRYPYYRIYVGNYIVFYVVISGGSKKVMEVRRVLYKRRKIDKII